MTISATTRLAFLPFRSPGGPFPDGIWASQLTVIGDASGGEAVMVHDVITLTEPFSALMLTIEQLLVDDGETDARDYLLQVIGFEEHNRVGNNNLLMTFVTVDTVGAVSCLGPNQTLRRPLFLGRCDRTSGQDSSISIRTANANGGSFRDALYGYYWGPGAMNEPGGPQRPPGSLFGN